MDIMVIVMVIIVAFVVLAIGGGIGYWLWVSSRPKKMAWKALVYQVGDGVIEKIREVDTKNIKYKLSDLKPYTTDIIEKVDRKNAATHYWLQKLKKPTPAVTADCVEVWSQNEKVVRVLLEEDSCTLLKSGYDRKIGSALFRPLPHDRINMIKTEMSERKDRIENTKDILSQIAPFVTIAITMIGLVCLVYFLAQAGIKQSENNLRATETAVAGQKEIAQMYLIATGKVVDPNQNTQTPPKVTKENPPTIPP